MSLLPSVGTCAQTAPFACHRPSPRSTCQATSSFGLRRKQNAREGESTRFARNAGKHSASGIVSLHGTVRYGGTVRCGTIPIVSKGVSFRCSGGGYKLMCMRRPAGSAQICLVEFRGRCGKRHNTASVPRTRVSCVPRMLENKCEGVQA